jgi:PAS domain S-box-containing protein
MNRFFANLHDRKRRLMILGIIMGALVGIVSLVSTLVLGYTSLKEQQQLLSDLVSSQITYIENFDRRYMDSPASMRERTPLAHTIDVAAMAQSRYRSAGGSARFCIARKKGGKIRFLVRDSKRVASDDPDAEKNFRAQQDRPMARALESQFGRTVAPNVSGNWAVMAYGPIVTRSGVLGMVAYIDLLEFLRPFAVAVAVCFAVGALLVVASLYLFFRISDPVLRALQESEREYRELVEGANNIIVRILRNGTIGLANRYAHDFFGMDQLVGKSAREILTSEKDERSIFDFSVGQKGQVAVEALAVRRDGTEAHISWAVRPVLDEDGSVCELLCIGVDVTPRYVAMQARREVEDRFRAIAKASPVGIVITDVHGNLVYANEKMHDMTDSYAAQMAGMGWMRHIHDQDRGAMKEFWVGNTGRDSASRLELRLLRGETVVWALVQRVSLRNRQGEKVGYVLTFTDVSQIKEAEARHKRLTAAIDQSAEIVIITDAYGVIEYVNPAFERVTGFSREEALGQNPSILSSGEQSEEFYADMWNTILRGDVWSGRFVNRRKDGSTYEQESTIAPVREEDGTIVNIVAVARDVTEQLALEAQLRQAQKLESIGELAAGIAHEINTPTQYVDSNLHFLETSFAALMKMTQGCIEVLEQARQSPDASDVVASLNEIMDKDEVEFLAEDVPGALKESLEGVQRVAEIVRSVKQLAHPGELKMAMHDMNEIIRNAVTVSTNEWKYASEMHLDLDESLPPVLCLKGEMSQVVLNLIVNAAHAVEERLGSSPDPKGDIFVRTREEGEHIVIEVEDTGAGMPESVVARVFDPFFTTKDVGKGTGQGLAIAHNVVVLVHGGTIDVQTEPGQGSTFCVRIPIEHPDMENVSSV